LVVTPSMTPIDAASRISPMSAESMKIFIARAVPSSRAGCGGSLGSIYGLGLGSVKRKRAGRACNRR
jgi:hypothetical protein